MAIRLLCYNYHMAKKKYKNKKQNADARLEQEGLSREAGRIVPVAKPKADAELVTPTIEAKAAAPKKPVVPPSVKKTSKPKPAKKGKNNTDNYTSNTQYNWVQKTIVFLIALGLVGSGFIALGSMPSSTPEVTTTPEPTETIVSEQEITIPAETTTPEAKD